MPRAFLAVGDIHGHLARLELALDTARRYGLPLLSFGDIVGGDQDTACLDRLRHEGCLVLRGNHDHWAVERAEYSLSESHLAWLAALPFAAENEDARAVHTEFEVENGQVFWRELSASVEVDAYLNKQRTKRYLFAAHSHRASVTRISKDRTEFLSMAHLRQHPVVKLDYEQVFIDVGWCEDNFVAVELDQGCLKFLFLER